MATGGQLKTYQFPDLIAVEVLRNGTSIHDTSQMAGGALLGGLLLGPAGMVLGALSSKARTQQNVQRLSLKVYVRDFQTPYYELVFFNAKKGVKANNKLALQAAEQLESWYGRFQAILASPVDTTPPEPPTPATTAIGSELKHPPAAVAVDTKSSVEIEDSALVVVTNVSPRQSKLGTIAKTSGLYILGTVLVLSALVMAIGGMWFLSASLFACAVMALPTTARLLRTRGATRIPPIAKAIFVFAIIIGAAALDSARVQQRSDEDYARRMIKEFQVSRSTILTEASQQQARGNFGGVIALGQRYADADDPELSALLQSARQSKDRAQAAASASDEVLALQPEPEATVASEQPVFKVADISVDHLIKGSDDYGRYKKVFATATRSLIIAGDCSEADFLEQGGWTRSSNAGDKPVYFTYCGGMTIANRIYLDATTGTTDR